MPKTRVEYLLRLDEATDRLLQQLVVDMMYYVLESKERVGKVTAGGLIQVLLQTHPILTEQAINPEQFAKKVLTHVRQFQRTGPKPKAKAPPIPTPKTKAKA